MQRRFAPAAIAAVLVLFACSDSTSPEPDAEALLADDIAMSSAAAVRGDILEPAGHPPAQMGVPRWLGGPPSMFDRADCPYSAATGWHECEALTLPGMTRSSAFAFFAAGGSSQERFDPATTESIASRVSRSGTVTTPRIVGEIEHSREMVVSGLSGTETRHIWNGTGTRDEFTQSVGDGPHRESTIVSRDTITDVVRLLPASANLWPASGTIVHNTTISQTIDNGTPVARSVSRRVVVTFNGTNLVPMTIGDRQVMLDLLTGRIARNR